MLKIGVRLPRQFEDSGEYLADARAMDAAGVDSLWLDDVGDEPWLLLAGIAAVPGRARLVAPVTVADLGTPAALDARAATLGRLSRGRCVLNVTDGAEVDGIEAAIERARRAGHPVILQAVSARQVQTATRLADGVISLDASVERLQASLASIVPPRDASDGRAPFEVWAAIAMPVDRESWRRTRAELEAAGATGVLVPADPRLLDLLRNGDEEDDRSDLALAQG
jgi:alkanesulfonate monooxygenase SsuD/methylene tetrahydromethanopterin reductase-like flavin-dependent oxidoreductase (luciferase family)